MPDVLYEDNHVLVAVKPPNMLSQGDATGDTDMLTELKEYIRVTYQKPGNVYLGLVHRLDRPVGGLMVFARTSKAAARLSEQMRKHEMGREYLCIVKGDAQDSFTLTDYLYKDPMQNKVVVCEADVKGSQLAVLHGRCLARRDGTSLCAIRLETGRKHQIRAQMAGAGMPLWGDNRYGGGIPGQQIALWGYKLTFIHPTTRKMMRFYSMPDGNAWSLYRDQLSVPEDAEEPKEPRKINLAAPVIQSFKAFNGKLYVPEEGEEDPLRQESTETDREGQILDESSFFL
ncbi:MAG: RluA family pseudouridine synthase [Clostridia bacterium]|nr:RluA family pseudouridine synthase [Clostridia bacterium]